jgi:hypothetical protein
MHCLARENGFWPGRGEPLVHKNDKLEAVASSPLKDKDCNIDSSTLTASHE